MEEAYVYCIPIADDELKIGSHLGSLKKLDGRYVTYVNKKLLAQKRYFRVEAPYRVAIEKTINVLIKRVDDGALFIENERFKRCAEPLFASYAPIFAMPPQRIVTTETATSPTIQPDAEAEKNAVNEVINNQLSLVDEVERKFQQMKLEKRLQAIDKHEREKKLALEQSIRALIYDIADAAVEQAEEVRARKMGPIALACEMFKNQFIVACDRDAIPWAVLREKFREWYDAHHVANGAAPMTARGDAVKKYFETVLTAETQRTVDNVRVRGFYGFTLKEN